jgi:hypothetical protein
VAVIIPSGTPGCVQPLTTGTPPPTYVARWGVTAHWPLTEVSDGSGAVTRNDVVGTSHLTDTNTVTNATGKVAAIAAQFTAANTEYLTVADNAALSVGDLDFWVACWAYFDSFGVLRAIASRRSGTNIRDYLLFYDTNAAPTANRFRFRVYNGTATEIATASSPVVPATGTWYLLVGYHDATNNLVGISVNGEAFTTAATTGVPIDTAAPLLVGLLVTPSSNPMNGRIEGLTIGKSPPLGIAAVADEIRDTLYASGSGLAYPWE